MKNKIFNLEKTPYVDLYIKSEYKFDNIPYLLDFFKISNQDEFFEEINELTNIYSIIFSLKYSKSYRCIVATLYIGEIKGYEKYVLSIINIDSNFFKKLYDNGINIDLSPCKAFIEMYKELPYEMRLKGELE